MTTQKENERGNMKSLKRERERERERERQRETDKQIKRGQQHETPSCDAPCLANSTICLDKQVIQPTSLTKKINNLA